MLLVWWRSVDGRLRRVYCVPRRALLMHVHVASVCHGCGVWWCHGHRVVVVRLPTWHHHGAHGHLHPALVHSMVHLSRVHWVHRVGGYLELGLGLTLRRNLAAVVQAGEEINHALVVHLVCLMLRGLRSLLPGWWGCLRLGYPGRCERFFGIVTADAGCGRALPLPFRNRARYKRGFAGGMLLCRQRGCARGSLRSLLRTTRLGIGVGGAARALI